VLAAIRAADLGARTVMLSSGEFGGMAANDGPVPVRTFVSGVAVMALLLRHALPIERLSVSGERCVGLVLIGTGSVAAMGTFASFLGWIAGWPGARGVRPQAALLGLCSIVAVAVGGFWIFSELW
jgi:hypothetical protein